MRARVLQRSPSKSTSPDPIPLPRRLRPRRHPLPPRGDLEFAYYPPGDLQPQDAGRGRVGDRKVYAPNIIFPLKLGRGEHAYMNSTIWGYGGGGFAGKGAAGGSECDPRNYDPMRQRDTFCEVRSFDTPLCPAGQGKQGQSIRPPSCADDRWEAVAVVDGVITSVTQSTQVELKGEDGTVYEYLYMHPNSIAVKRGDRVKQGDLLGRVSNYMGGKPNTTRQLTFNIEQTIRIGDKDERVYVPPYTSLIAAYRRAKGLDPGIGPDGNLIVDPNHEIGAGKIPRPEEVALPSSPADVAAAKQPIPTPSPPTPSPGAPAQPPSQNDPSARFTDEQIVPMISVEAVVKMIEFEATSEQDYERRYIKPVLPSLASGINIGIGYDLGASSPDQIRASWREHLSLPVVERLAALSGLTGDEARKKLPELQDIIVPWEAALGQFRRDTVTRFGRMVLGAFPNADALHGDAFGALVSLVYNRGTSLQGERREEMRRIRDHMAAQEFAKIPNEMRAMKRLWAGDPSVQGVVKRREAEALLFERGLVAMGLTPLQAVEPPPPTTTLRILAIGVDRYPGLGAKCGPSLNQSCDLRYASADAQMFADSVRRTMGRRHTQVDTQTLVSGGQPPTAADIRAALDRFVALSRESDTVVVLIAGRGESIADGRALFLPGDAGRAPSESASTQPVTRAVRAPQTSVPVFDNALPWDEIQDRVSQARGRRLLFIDASGYPDRLLQSAEDTNLAVFVATSADQTPIEGADQRQGAFAAALARELAGAATAPDGTLTAQTLADDIAREVKARTNGRQTPRFSGSEIILLSPAAEAVKR